MNWSRVRDTIQLPLLTSEQRIRGISGPISRPVHDALVRLIDSDYAVLEQTALVNYLGEMEEQRLRGVATEERYAEAKLARQQAEEQVARVEREPRSLLLALLYAVSAATAGVCEFLVSWATLPQLLEIPRDSLKGVSISLAPIVCFLLLKHPVDWFLHSAPQRAVLAFYAFMAAGVAWLTYAMVYARAESTRVLAAILRGDLNVELREEVVTSFLLAVSIVLVFAGAVLLSHAFHEGTAIAAVVAGRQKVRRLFRTEAALHDALAVTRMRVAELELDSAVRPRLLADAWRHRVLELLAGVEIAVLPIDEELDRRLGFGSPLRLTA